MNQSIQLPHWDRDRRQICSLLESAVVQLKIILKTKDDFHGVKHWVDHHFQIVGTHGLVIADNCSDPAVASRYSELPSGITIFQYGGFHNLIHETSYFPDLYRSIRSSCEYFTFLDTDERLVLFDGCDRFLRHSEPLNFLRAQRSAVFPGTWLQNVMGYHDRFSLYDQQNVFSTGLKWGKPVISSVTPLSGMINHNTQLPPEIYEEDLRADFFVLHLSKLSKQQRIDANLRKLRAYGALSQGEGMAQALALEDASLSGNVAMYCREIRALAAMDTPEKGSSESSIQIREDGTVLATLDWQLAALRDFVKNPKRFAGPLFDRHIP